MGGHKSQLSEANNYSVPLKSGAMTPLTANKIATTPSEDPYLIKNQALRNDAPVLPV